jgi:nucleoside-diphosphate-sugar epimerase
LRLVHGRECRGSCKRAAFAPPASSSGIDAEYTDFPDDVYGLRKLVGEQLAKAYAERYGIQTTSFRMATVWVPGNSVTEQELSQLLAPEMDSDLEFLDLRWQYVDVQDVAQAYRLALEASDGLGVCNVGAADTPGGDWRVWLSDIYPDVPALRTPRSMTEDPTLPLWSIDRLARATGFAPAHSWSEYPTFVKGWETYLERREGAATSTRRRQSQ